MRAETTTRGRSGEPLRAVPIALALALLGATAGSGGAGPAASPPGALRSLPRAGRFALPALEWPLEFDPEALDRLREGANQLLAPFDYEIDLPSAEALTQWLSGLDELLASASLEEIAAWAPWVEQAADEAAADPLLQRHAPELQRLAEYYKMTSAVERDLQRWPPERPQPAQERRPIPWLGPYRMRPGGRIVDPDRAQVRPETPRSAPPPRGAQTPARADTATAEREVASVRRWKERLATRPVPASAARWLPTAKQAFAAEGIPPELVWMAEVESSWDPGAVSSAGAKGLFQLMPDTAESLGLPARPPQDGRGDAAKNARAAARYLKQLHRRFGQWHLAIAAYNGGEGRVAQAVRKSGDKRFSRLLSALPRETRMYVPRVYATIWAREGVDPGRLPAPADRPVPIETALERAPGGAGIPITLD